MIVSEIGALDVLTSKFNLSQLKAREVIVELNAIGARIHTHIEDEFHKRKDIFLTKDDKVELIEKIENQKVELIEKIENQKVELIEKIENQKVELIEKMETQRVELVEKIERSRADMIKWMFIFWITQLVAMAGLFQFFFGV